MKQEISPTRNSRRDFLALLGIGGIGLLSSALFPQRSFATVDETLEAIDKLTRGKAPVEDKVRFEELPKIAENGNVVPCTISVDSPMTDQDYVKAIHILAEGNPKPGVATFHLTPESGKAWVRVRMRLADTQNVVAVAEMSDGAMYIAKQKIKVTIGGCGG
uniref:Thiosulfate-binding protein SoxY n=1 Tax=Candidatus Kentrum sp. TUN TaxID=2126343 RepID=A0A450ZLI1_9GAMM|nr:MAG: thiosulfate-binding protein SoxY [Candidatus Kentron sp. TUN]VFK58090.1 MAG: thiosulfate-binding protein SoxY [Candidatus Kentron sp. TUN]VFK59809.1 MAG: thiosulfate-binding protein SoxY [Candidatus Kentron sp. TUN]